MAVLPTATESPLLYACELWVFAMCPALRGSTVSYAGDAHFPKHSLEYSLNFWSQSKKKNIHSSACGTIVSMELPNIAAYAYQDVHVWSALFTCLRPKIADSSPSASTPPRQSAIGTISQRSISNT